MTKAGMRGGLLLIGYVLGQGSAFVVQLLARGESPVIAGEVVLYLSLFSICFQFSDYGNATYGVKSYLAKDNHAFYSYLCGRALIAIPVAIVTAFFFFPADVDKRLQIDFLLVLPIAASLFSLIESAKVEARGNYAFLAFIQGFPWVVTALFLYFIVIRGVASFSSVLWLWLVIPLSLLVATNSNIFRSAAIFSLRNIAAMTIPLAFLVPAILGQLWAREMLILIANREGVESLGPLGLMRSIQTAGCVAIGLLMRPIIAAHIRQMEFNENALNQKKSLVGKFYWINLVVSFPIILLVLFPVPYIPSDVSRWLPAMLGVPIWGFTNAYIAQNQIEFSGRVFSGIEIAGLVINAIVFTWVLFVSPEWAFPAADLARLIFIVCISRVMPSK